MRRVARALLTVAVSSLCTFGVLRMATAVASGPTEPSPPERAITPDVTPTRRAPARDLPGIFVPPLEVTDRPEIAEERRTECDPGARKPCWPDGMGPSVVPDAARVMRCQLFSDGTYHWEKSACNTPLVVSFDDAPITFTSPERAASFPIGVSGDTEWVSSATPWLALDADGSGCIERQDELFGGGPDDANGFAKLARHDANHDGRIDAQDPVFADLVLWADTDQDRRCTSTELTRVRDAGVVAIELGYTTAPAPPIGSFEGERATFVFRGSDGSERRGRVVDVYLAARGGPATLDRGSSNRSYSVR
ncbi:MAG: hypothetical protein JST00_39565 [Deltaproteobacteria bacterium]|nr:hypothetical protein [Deltaproteobacteria bacterium]